MLPTSAAGASPPSRPIVGRMPERLVRDRVFRDDLMVLATGGLPLWDGMSKSGPSRAPRRKRQNGEHRAPSTIREGNIEARRNRGSPSSLRSPTRADVDGDQIGAKPIVRCDMLPDLHCIECRYSASVHMSGIFSSNRWDTRTMAPAALSGSGRPLWAACICRCGARPLCGSSLGVQLHDILLSASATAGERLRSRWARS